MNLSPIRRRYQKAADHYVAVGNLPTFLKATLSARASCDKAMQTAARKFESDSELTKAREEITKLESWVIELYDSAQTERRLHLATLLERARYEAEEERRERNIRHNITR